MTYRRRPLVHYYLSEDERKDKKINERIVIVFNDEVAHIKDNKQA